MNILKKTKDVIHGWLTKIHIISLGFLLRNLTCSFLVGKDCREISACSKGCGAWLLARNAWAGCPCFMFLCCGSMWKQLQFLQVLHVPTCVVHCWHVRKHFDLRNSILNTFISQEVIKYLPKKGERCDSQSNDESGEKLLQKTLKWESVFHTVSQNWRRIRRCSAEDYSIICAGQWAEVTTVWIDLSAAWESESRAFRKELLPRNSL